MSRYIFNDDAGDQFVNPVSRRVQNSGGIKASKKQKPKKPSLLKKLSFAGIENDVARIHDREKLINKVNPPTNVPTKEEIHKFRAEVSKRRSPENIKKLEAETLEKAKAAERKKVSQDYIQGTLDEIERRKLAANELPKRPERTKPRSPEELLAFDKKQQARIEDNIKTAAHNTKVAAHHSDFEKQRKAIKQYNKEKDEEQRKKELAIQREVRKNSIEARIKAEQERHNKTLRGRVTIATNKVGDVIDNVQDNLSRKYNSLDHQRIATLAGGAAAAIGVAALVSNIIKKRKWKIDGCKNIENPDKQSACKRYVFNAAMKDAKRDCKYANNPDKCKSMVLEKLREQM